MNAQLFRERLLTIEPPDPGREEQLQKEIQHMFDKPLTGKTRLWWAISLMASILFVAWGLLILLTGGLDAYLRVVWIAYVAANAAFACYAGYVLKRGIFRLRHFLTFIAIVSPGGSLLCAAVLIARSVALPSLVSVVWAIFGLLCVMVALAWILHGRIAQAELATREQFLNLELRNMQAVEKREGSGA